MNTSAGAIEMIYHTSSAFWLKITTREIVYEYDMCGGGVMAMIYITFNNSVIFALVCFSAMVEKDNIMTTVHRKAMVYGSQQAEHHK